MTNRNLVVLALSAVMLLPACLRAQESVGTSGATNQTISAKTDDDRPALQKRYPRYKVQRDDVLNVTFPLSPELNQIVAIQPDGYITLQNGGSTYVLGMTLPEVVEAIKKNYAGVLHDPIVDIDLKDFQKPYFVVLGQVGKPGQYDLRYDMTVTEAVAMAGGFASTAKTQVFLFHRDGANWVEAKELKLNSILNGKRISEDPEMHPGDMIFVPEKTITKIRKYVPYGVGVGVTPVGSFID